MSSETDNRIVKPETEDKTDESVQNEARPKFFLIIVAGLVLVFAGLTYFASKKFQNLTEHKHVELDSLDSKISSLEKNISFLKEEQAGLVESVDSLVEAQLSLEKNISTLYREQNSSNQEWALAEVEYLLLIATHRLALEADIKTALAAMQAADNRLKNLPDPGLLSVRKQLMADMNSLQSYPIVDIPGLALYLADLVQRTDKLPLRESEIAPEREHASADIQEEPSAPWWERMFAAVWRELKDVIIISHEDQKVEVSLLPQQEFFLRQNLRLQLESARYAVLRRDTEGLHTSVELINNWLTDYFDISDTGVTNILDSLLRMKTLELRPDVPEITSSLETVRAYLSVGDGDNSQEEDIEDSAQ